MEKPHLQLFLLLVHQHNKNHSLYLHPESEVGALGGGVKEIDETPKPPDGDIKGDEADKERLKGSLRKEVFVVIVDLKVEKN